MSHQMASTASCGLFPLKEESFEKLCIGYMREGFPNSMATIVTRFRYSVSNLIRCIMIHICFRNYGLADNLFHNAIMGFVVFWNYWNMPFRLTILRSIFKSKCCANRLIFDLNYEVGSGPRLLFIWKCSFIDKCTKGKGQSCGISIGTKRLELMKLTDRSRMFPNVNLRY